MPNNSLRDNWLALIRLCAFVFSMACVNAINAGQVAQPWTVTLSWPSGYWGQADPWVMGKTFSWDLYFYDDNPNGSPNPILRGPYELVITTTSGNGSAGVIVHTFYDDFTESPQANFVGYIVPSHYNKTGPAAVQLFGQFFEATGGYGSFLQYPSQMTVFGSGGTANKTIPAINEQSCRYASRGSGFRGVFNFITLSVVSPAHGATVDKVEFVLKNGSGQEGVVYTDGDDEYVTGGGPYVYHGSSYVLLPATWEWKARAHWKWQTVYGWKLFGEWKYGTDYTDSADSSWESYDETSTFKELPENWSTATYVETTSSEIVSPSPPSYLNWGHRP